MRVTHFNVPGGSRVVATDAPLIASKTYVRTSGGLSAGPLHPHNVAMTERYGRADERLCYGQLIVFRDDIFLSMNHVSRSWRSPGSGRVFGFSSQQPWCVIVAVDGVKYPQRYSHHLWEPR